MRKKLPPLVAPEPLLPESVNPAVSIMMGLLGFTRLVADAIVMLPVRMMVAFGSPSAFAARAALRNCPSVAAR
jgi:hypothetical protein